MLSKKVQVSSYKLQVSGGYAALVSFGFMLAVFAVVTAVFAALVAKSRVAARLGFYDLGNIYAAEGFVEDVIRRANDSKISDALSGETLTINGAVVTLTITPDGPFLRHDFYSQLQSKYFFKETVLIDDSPKPGKVKIKEWREIW